MHRFLCGSALLIAVGCAATPFESGRAILRNFSEVERSVGQEVTVRGFVSQSHGAAGLYLSRRDLREQNHNCILPGRFEGIPHLREISVSGRLERTECGTGRICTNVCDRYVLLHPDGR